MIIFGTSGVTTSAESGTFYCPECAARRPYQLKKVRRFFTLYFIPIVPLDTLGEFVECQVCKGTYRKQVLGQDPRAQAQQVEAELRKAIRRVMVHMMLADVRMNEKEIETICALYEKITGRALRPEQVYAEATFQTETSNEICNYLAGAAGLLNDEGKEVVVKAVYLVAISDGDLSEREESFLFQVGRALQMSKHHIRAVLEEVRAEADKYGGDGYLQKLLPPTFQR